MVRVRCQNSNRNTVKQTAENGRKFSGDRDAAGINHFYQASKIRGSGMVLNSTGCHRFSTAGRVRTDSGWSGPFRIARVTLHDCKVAPLRSQAQTCYFFFAVYLTIFLFEFRPQTFTIGFYGENIYQIRAYDFGVQFSFNHAAVCCHNMVKWVRVFVNCSIPPPFLTQGLAEMDEGSISDGGRTIHVSSTSVGRPSFGKEPQVLKVGSVK